MTADEESIFAEALDRTTPTERAAYLAQACGGDTQLHAAVESLLLAN